MGFGPLPTSYPLPIGVCFLRVKEKQREADHLSEVTTESVELKSTPL